MKNAKKRAITDLNAPSGSRDIPFQSQELGQDGYHHFGGFQPYFQLNMTSQTSYLSENEAKNLQNGDAHIAQIPDFETGYLENHWAH